MPLVNTSVPNLVQGVSQQPDTARYDGQCEEQENALSSVVDGLTKRPSTRHIAKLLSEAITSNSFVHFINRSSNERYVVITYQQFDSYNNHTSCKIRAFNILSGEEATITANGVSYNASFLSVVNPATGANYTQSEIDSDSTKSNTSYILNGSNFPYLHANSPKDDLKALSIGDTTLLLNNKVAVAPNTTRTSEIDKEALIFITQGAFNSTYNTKFVIFDDSDALPSGVTAPVIEVELEQYVHSTSGGSYGYYNYNYTTFRWRVKSVSLLSAGSGLTNVPAVSITSNGAIYTQPNIQLSVDLDTSSSTYGEATGVTVADDERGELQGAQTGSVTNNNFGTIEPTVSVNIAGYAAPTLANFTATTSTVSNANSGKTNVISNSIKSSIETLDTNNYLTVTRPASSGNVYARLNDQNKDLSVASSDSLADTGIQAVYKEIDSITSLPLNNKQGFKVKIKGDAELASDDFYVQFETAQGQSYGSGSYVETVGDNIVTGYDASTMPHQLINSGLNLFTLSETNYEDRLAGDDGSNPLPSFVGSEIESMFFFKNRLGFLSKDNIIMSEAGFGSVNQLGQTVFNFGRTTVSALLDSDPVDVAVATSRVTNLKSAKGFQENLIIFSENGQFVLKGGDVLTPRTVSITPITNFEFDEAVDPIPLGAYIYFPFNRSGFTGVREFTVNSTTDNYDSVEITEHVPKYVPSNLIDFAGSTNEDMLALVSGDESGSIYIYKYFFSGNRKLLSSWFKFTFDGEIRGIEFIQSIIYIVLCKNNETHLVELPLTANISDSVNVDHSTLLDMRKEFTIASGANTIDLSNSYTADENKIQVYTKDGLKLSSTNTGTTVTLSNAVTSDTPVFVGIPYTMKYTFSEQIFKASTGQSKSPSPAAKLIIRNGAINFNNTAFFKVKVTPQFRDTFENIFTPTVVGSSTLGSLDLDTGSYRFPIFTKAEDTTITIENDSALPSNFQSAEFESFVHSRSNRIA